MGAKAILRVQRQSPPTPRVLSSSSHARLYLGNNHSTPLAPSMKGKASPAPCCEEPQPYAPRAERARTVNRRSSGRRDAGAALSLTVTVWLRGPASTVSRYWN